MREVEETFEGLEEELLGLFRRGVDQSLPDEDFNGLALRVFRFQCRANAPFGAFVRLRGLEAESVTDWEEIPHLPTQAFKTVDLVTGDGSDVEAVFRTSGTTAGGQTRGRHLIRSLNLYRGALLPNFRAHLLPDGVNLPILALIPDPDELPDSSLSYMVGQIRDFLCAGRTKFFAHSSHGVQAHRFFSALKAAEKDGNPVLLIGTAFSFVHWLEAADGEGWRVKLPGGSRLMETGGFKGRSKVLSREGLYSRLEESFGIPTSMMVNEYGMTELLSQFYEPVLVGSEEGTSGVSTRHHVAPPWVRTRVLDPMTLEPVPKGDVGILAHFDLANLGSVSGVLTEDLGRVVLGGFSIQGRNPGAEPRGCSLAMEDFLGGLRGVHDAF